MSLLEAILIAVGSGVIAFLATWGYFAILDLFHK